MTSTKSSASSSPLGSFLSSLLQENNCTSFGVVVMDNPRPTLLDRTPKNTHNSLPTNSTHSMTRWDETSALPRPTSSNIATDSRRLIPVVRKPSPIAKPHGIPSCPIRKLSQDSAAGNHSQGAIMNPSKETGQIVIDKQQTLSKALKLPLYDPLEDHQSRKCTDSTVSSMSSTGSDSRPPLPPKKNATPLILPNVTLVTSKTLPGGKKKMALVHKHLKQTSTKKTKISVGKEGVVPDDLQGRPTKKQTTPAKHQCSPTSASPRSITDYTIATMDTKGPSGRRTLSKTLMGADQAEKAPVQPQRLPSSEPAHHNVVDSKLSQSSTARHSTARNLFRRHSSTFSVSSSNSSAFSDAPSQSSSNSDTIATYPSFCSSHASEVTIKVKNGSAQDLDEIVEVSAAPPVTARSLSFLPTPLEQVSERSFSDQSESTPSPLVTKKRLIRAEDIIFQPSTDCLPVDHQSIVNSFEEPAESPRGKTKGRLFRMMKKFY